MATQPEFFPLPDAVPPQAPPEAPAEPQPAEEPFFEPPEILPDVPDQDYPDREKGPVEPDLPQKEAVRPSLRNERARFAMTR